jgi:hypothetical protein
VKFEGGQRASGSPRVLVLTGKISEITKRLGGEKEVQVDARFE